MRIRILDTLAFFESRATHPCGSKNTSLTLLLPKSGAALLNGTHRISASEQVLHLPIHLLRQGENTLVLYIDGYVIPCESFVYDGKTVFPAGLKSEEMLIALSHEAARQRERADALEARLSSLEAAYRGRTLFA